MKFILLTSLLFSFNAMAKTFVYDIMTDYSTPEKQGTQVEIKLDGDFKKGSKVLSLKVTALKPAVTLFFLDTKEVNANFNIVWKDEKTLYIQNNGKEVVKSSVQKSYSNGYGDAPVQRGHEYVIAGDNEEGFEITSEGTTGEYERFVVGNMTQGESAIFGQLKINTIK